MIYLFLAPLIIVTYGSLLAYMQSIWMPEERDAYFRRDMGICALFALLPPAWFLHPFITGFYEHGLQFTRRRNKS